MIRFQRTNLQDPSWESYKDALAFEKDAWASHFPYHIEEYHWNNIKVSLNNKTQNKKIKRGGLGPKLKIYRYGVVTAKLSDIHFRSTAQQL